MPNINMKPNSTTSDEYVGVDIEANPKDEDGPAALYLSLTHDEDEVEILETEADAIRELRDAVVAECDKAIRFIEAQS